jgi:hypothetical protein
MAKHSLQTNSKNYPNCWAKPRRDILLKPFAFVSHRYLNLYDTISFDMSYFHCCIGCPAAVLFFSKLVMRKVRVLSSNCLVEQLQSTNCFTFHFTNFPSRFLNKLMLNRNYFLILSLVKE